METGTDLPDLSHRERSLEYPLLMLFLAMFFVVVARGAWLSDDAFISYRTVDNFVNGYGLTWNVTERVQVYTHPLWMFLVSLLRYFTGEVYLTAYFLSFVCTMAALWIFAFHVAATPAAALLGISLLTFSKAFVDYSSSGLENPLTHLLLVIFISTYLKGRRDSAWLFRLSLIAGLAAFNRLDTILFYIPCLAVGFFSLQRGGRIIALVEGFAPLALWEGFCLLYYGFAFPNTAYAKLNTGVPGYDLWVQGICYLLNSMTIDPLTLIVILSGLSIPLVMRDHRSLPVAIGITFYLYYVIKVGGDFMSGRFLSAALIGAVCLIGANLWLSLRSALPAFFVLLFIPFFSPHAQYLLDLEHPLSMQYAMIDNKGIADERAFYREATGLNLYSRKNPLPKNTWILEGKAWKEVAPAVVVRENIGFFAFYAGPEVHVVDNWALADPLLARLPAKDEEWRIGHFERAIPDGYIATLESGENQIKDKNLAQYYDSLGLIIRGPIFNWERIKVILKMNLGYYDHLLWAEIPDEEADEVEKSTPLPEGIQPTSLKPFGRD